MFGERQVIVRDGTSVKLAAEDDIPGRGTEAFVVALDKHITSELQARVEGDAQPGCALIGCAGNGNTINSMLQI